MVHFLTVMCAQFCIQKLKHPKLLKILATHVTILGTCVTRTESHRMFEVGRDLWRTIWSNSLLKCPFPVASAGFISV